MLQAADQDSPHEPPVQLQLEQHVRAMFNRTIASWATDALSLRRRGLDRPSTRPAGYAPVAPAFTIGDWSEPCYRESPSIRWLARSDITKARLTEF